LQKGKSITSTYHHKKEKKRKANKKLDHIFWLMVDAYGKNSIQERKEEFMPSPCTIFLD